MLAALAGDPDATIATVRYLKDTLRPLFWKYFPGADVSELVQATVTKLFQKVDLAPDDPELFDLWVYGFGHTQARATIGERKREEARSLRLNQYADVPKTSIRASMDRAILRDQQQRLVLRCLADLPDIYREAIEHHLDDGDHESLARDAGISVVGARFRLWKGRKLLRNLVAQARMTRGLQGLAEQTS
jgi:DNA-directed RNA polymerase specialized sigma24 family protein